MRTALRATALLLAVVVAGCATAPSRPGAPHGPPAAPPPVVAPAGPVPRPSDAQLLLLPDAVPRAEPRAALGNPPFYALSGQPYVVLESSHAVAERGVADRKSVVEGQSVVPYV